MQAIKGIISRNEFGDLCNQHKLTDTAVEIGVDRASFAVAFLERWKGVHMWCIDPWEPYWEIGWDREADYLMSCFRLAPFGDRVRILRGRSEDVAPTLDRHTRPEFVYIDAQHTYEFIARDIATWWPRVQPGGILSGHDYDNEHQDVIRAVNEFVERESLQLYLTQDNLTAASWYVFKKK